MSNFWQALKILVTILVLSFELSEHDMTTISLAFHVSFGYRRSVRIIFPSTRSIWLFTIVSHEFSVTSTVSITSFCMLITWLASNRAFAIRTTNCSQFRRVHAGHFILLKFRPFIKNIIPFFSRTNQFGGEINLL